MKFIINENKLEIIVLRYLDNQDFIIKKQPKGNVVFLNSEDDEKGQIVFNKEKNIIGIVSKLRREVQDFFSISKNESDILIGKWVESKLNLEPTETINLPFILVLPDDEI